MAIRSSAQLNAGRDDDRLSPGFKKQSADVLFGGMVVTNLVTDVTGKTLQIFGVAGSDGIITAANPFPLGLVFENTLPFSPPASGDEDAGDEDGGDAQGREGRQGLAGEGEGGQDRLAGEADGEGGAQREGGSEGEAED